jgi:hypothetical protein
MSFAARSAPVDPALIPGFPRLTPLTARQEHRMLTTYFVAENIVTSAIRLEASDLRRNT